MAQSWGEKLLSGAPAHVSPMTKATWGMKKGDKLFIATPVMVRDYMKKIRKGSAKTIVEMREELAKAHKATATCPMTASIFARIAAEAAIEEMEDGKPAEKIAPFWSCGTAFVAKMRAKEGIE
jgi:hypothetical protein